MIPSSVCPTYYQANTLMYMGIYGKREGEIRSGATTPADEQLLGIFVLFGWPAEKVRQQRSAGR